MAAACAHLGAILLQHAAMAKRCTFLFTERLRYDALQLFRQTAAVRAIFETLMGACEERRLWKEGGGRLTDEEKSVTSNWQDKQLRGERHRRRPAQGVRLDLRLETTDAWYSLTGVPRTRRRHRSLWLARRSDLTRSFFLKDYAVDNCLPFFC